MIHNCEVEGVVLSVQACWNKSEAFLPEAEALLTLNSPG